MFDADFRVVSCNRRYRQLVGVAYDDLASKSGFEINQYGSERQREVRTHWPIATLNELAPSDTRTSLLFRYDIADAPGGPVRERFWRLTGSVMALSEHSERYIALRLSDETARAANLHEERQEKARLRSQAQLCEAQLRLNESREALAEALKFAGIGAWQLDMSTGEISCTDQCKFNMGLAVDEPLSEKRLFSQVIRPDDRERVGGLLTDALKNHRSCEAEYRHANRPERWVLAGGRAQYAPSGMAVRMSGSMLDITAGKLEEAALLQTAREQREAREESESNALAMDHFLTAVTHELPSPIGVILNWSAPLRTKPATP